MTNIGKRAKAEKSSLQKGKAQSRLDEEAVFYDLVLNVTQAIFEAMQANGLTRSELAKLAGVQKEAVSRLFGGFQNLTLKTIAKFSSAMGLQPEFALRDQQAATGTQSYVLIHDRAMTIYASMIKSGNAAVYSSAASSAPATDMPPAWMIANEKSIRYGGA
jgi:transcriptional regulator with XRE-family HTH domain